MNISDKETERKFKTLLYFCILNLMGVSQAGLGQFVTEDLLRMV